VIRIRLAAKLNLSILAALFARRRPLGCPELEGDPGAAKGRSPWRKPWWTDEFNPQSAGAKESKTSRLGRISHREIRDDADPLHVCFQ
jgi:hypothetical protein